MLMPSSAGASYQDSPMNMISATALLANVILLAAFVCPATQGMIKACDLELKQQRRENL